MYDSCEWTVLLRNIDWQVIDAFGGSGMDNILWDKIFEREDENQKDRSQRQFKQDMIYFLNLIF